MTPDSDTYQHILMNGFLWYALIFGIPTLIHLGRKALRRFNERVDQRVDQRTNLHVHAALHPNVRILEKGQR